jgi:AAA-like domain
VIAFPLRYAHANIIFGPQGEAAALYRLETVSYPFLPERDKLLWFERLAHFAFACECDFSLWRVARTLSAERYRRDARTLVDPRFALDARWRRYVDGQADALASIGSVAPELYVALALDTNRPRTLGSAFLTTIDSARRRVERIAGVAAPEPITASEFTMLVAAEQRSFRRLAATLLARRATTRELQWLLRRAPLRGVAEPELDAHWQPNALAVQTNDGEVCYEPLETDVLRHGNASVLEEERTLVVDGEQGRSYQALLALGALPEEVEFPGARAELASAPLEALGFPVDLALHARWIGNRDALARVRRRILDADNVYVEQAGSEHGPTWRADENRTLARELQAHLESEAHPPLLQVTISFAVGSPTRAELERRVELLRGQFGAITLHRPLGLQPHLYRDHLPHPSGPALGEYAEYLTLEQFAALMPLATHEAGSERGVYVGTTGAGSPRPVLFDIAAAPREGRPPSILLAGTLGSGKTLAAELLALQAALRGALVVDVDPKPDHRLEAVPELAGSVEVIELSGEPRYAGLLDPLQVAPPSLREDLASSYFAELLPQAKPEWETQIRKAVRAACRGDAATSLTVVELLTRSSHPDARDAGDALAVWADSGLGRLAFGERLRQRAGAVQPVTTIRASGLSLPSPGAARADYSQAERLSVATLKLVAAFALRLVSGDRSRTKVLLFDEAWFLLASSDGRRVIDRLNRLGRSENATLILATQQLGDIGEIENLIGTRFLFGHETVGEAERALALLGLDPHDRQLVQRLRSYRRGRCLMRDLDDRIAEVQFDLVYPHLLDALDTTPPVAQPAVAVR